MLTTADRAVAALRGLFADSLVVDDRSPCAMFSVPGVDGTFGLFLPKPEFWHQLVLLVLLQIVPQCLCAAFVYRFIVQKRGSVQAYLLGWGVVVPLAVCSGHAILRLLQIQNKAVKMAAGLPGTVVGFRAIEAMYGTPPYSAVEASIGHYMAYYSSLVLSPWLKDTQRRQKAPPLAALKSVAWLVLLLLAVSVYASFLLHFDFTPVPNDNVQLDAYNFSIDLFKPQHVINAYLHIYLVYLVLSIGFGGVAVAPELAGFATVPVFRNPMFASRTPTEFWTKRWNLMHHNVFKHGVFRPASKHMDKRIALLLTFLVSGVYHEWSWSHIFYQYEQCSDEMKLQDPYKCHRPVLGRTTLFFFLTAVYMVVERPFSKLPYVKAIGEKLPTVVVSTFLVVLHAPFAHMYYGDWIRGGHTADFTMGTFLVKRIDV